MKLNLKSASDRVIDGQIQAQEKKGKESNQEYLKELRAEKARRSSK